MTTVRALSLCFILLFVSGCASMTGLLTANENVDKSKGVLLAGVTSDDNVSVLDAWYFYRKKGSEEERRLDAWGLSGIGLITYDDLRSDDYPENKTKDGRLLALSLEAGEYELFNYMLYIQQLGGHAYVSPEIAPPPFSFTISPGKVTYLGNLHIDTITGQNFLGITIPVGANPDITDNQKVDMPLLKLKYPNLNDWPVQISVPDGSAWKRAQ